MQVLSPSVSSIQLPKMVKVRQRFDTYEIKDITGTIYNEIMQPGIKEKIKPGSRVAIAVGSRGISNLSQIVKAVIECLKDLGTHPFIVPAMGSHGGGTAEGQIEILSSYGINEETMQVPIVSSMEVVKIGETRENIPVFIDKTAYESDMIVLINRVKPHTDFTGPIGSGLCKMMAIGLGNHEGCSRLHQEGFDKFHQIIPSVAKEILRKAPVGFGVAIVENAYHRPYLIKAIRAEDIIEEEPKLLNLATDLMAGIMVPEEIDVLIVEKLGKDISGAGMDPNVIGKTARGVLPGFKGPRIKRIVVLDLSEGTEGNACGIGIADFITRKLFDKINLNHTYTNVIASANPEAGKIPIIMENEREAIIAALQCCGRTAVTNPQLVKIKNTLELEEIFVSENLLPRIQSCPNIEITTETVSL